MVQLTYQKIGVIALRQYKFRAKSDGQWVYGSHVKTGVGLHYIIPQNLISNDIIQFSVKKETVGQYTGLKDRNGKEIYENDIVKYTKIIYTDCSRKEIDDIEESLTGEIYYAEGIWLGIRLSDDTGRLFIAGTVSTDYDNLEFEVIGNIYENPELLKKAHIG